MTRVSNERIFACISNNLQALSGTRSKQQNLIEFAKMNGFTLQDVDQSLSHAIVMGGAVDRGETWPLNWQDARESLTADQRSTIENEYRRIIDAFPEELKKQNPKLFV